jgi:transposase
MYRVRLNEDQQTELRRRAHQSQVAPRVRDRREMVRLGGMGWSIPKIALHLGQQEQTVRFWIKAFLEGGLDALTDKPPTGQQSAVTPEIMAAVKEWLTAGNRTWNARQIAQEVAARYGLSRSVSHWRRPLRRQDLTYKRTKRTLRHKQDPQAVAAKTAEIAALKRGRKRAGRYRACGRSGLCHDF